MAAVLAIAAVSKLTRARQSQAALTTFGLRTPLARWSALLAVSTLELALAVGVALGSAVAAYAAAGLLALFAAGLTVALRAGRAGAPCGCFGPRSRVGWGGVARGAALAVGFALVPLASRLGRDDLLLAGLVVALTGVVVLGVAVLALAREVGMLRLRLPPEAALEVLSEGPEIGERTRVVDRIRLDERTRLALAVFTSEGCRMCAALEPAIAALGHDELVGVARFDEVRDHDVWRELAIPGSPYAVGIGPDGTVLAKGTFNTYAQLEGLVAAAERRAAAAGV